MRCYCWISVLAVCWGCASGPSTGADGARVPESEKGNFAALKADDPEVAAAKKKAQESLDSFISKYNSKDLYKAKMVKFPMPVKGQTEHIWMDVSEIKDGTFIGTLANDSFYDPQLKVGAPVSVHRNDVEDWMLMDRKDNMEGGFSIEAVRKHAK